MSDAYAQGIHHALTALAWATGVLTITGFALAVLYGLFLAAVVLNRAIAHRVTSRRLKREHRLSGRS